MKNRDLSFIGKLKKLKRLELRNCGTIDSISFINDMPNLEYVIIFETNITDGDITPLTRMEYAAIDDKRNFNLKNKDLKRIQQSRKSANATT